MAEPADRESGARALEVALLGGAADLTREQVEAESGDVEATRRLWRALGFVDLESGVPILARADAEALHRTRRLVAERGVDERTAVALARALGQAMGHLAEAQVETVAEAIGRDPELAGKARADPDAFVAEMLPLVEPVIAEMQELMLYVWRRHLVAAGQRSLAGAAAVTPAAPVVVGFADVVNYTSVTRDMRSADLAALVEDFEDRAFDAVARHGGRVVKTLGDEVMFTAATPQAGAEAGLALAAEFGEGRVPPVRVGLAYGPAVARGGDVFGPVVNIASRCTSLARPSTVIADRTLADALSGSPAYLLKRLSAQRVRGYEHLVVSVLRRAGA